MPGKKAVKQDLSFVSYTIGIVSIVMAFFQPLAGLILGIIGFVQSKNKADDLSKRAKKLNIVGMILSIAVVIISAVVIYLAQKSLANFPIA